MKKLFLFSWILLMANFLMAQWEPNVRLTNDPNSSSTSYNMSKCIAASGDTVHIVWLDNRDGNDEIYYKRSIDGGNTWGQDMRITNDLGISFRPAISLSGVLVHVTWADARDGNGVEIYYKRSQDGGTTWEGDVRLTYSPYNSHNPSITSLGLVVNIVWYDFRDLQWDIYSKRSTDGGLTWDADARLTYDPADSFNASIAGFGPDIHVVWGEYRDGNGEIYYKHSLDEGVTWGQDIRLTDDTAASRRPSISTSGNLVCVVWQDQRDSNIEIYFKRSEDGGISWEADTRLTDAIGDSQFPSVAVSGSLVHVVWYDNRDGDMEIYYKKSEDGGTSWEADMRLTNVLGDSQFPSIALSGSLVHVVWTDKRDGNEEIYYKRDPTGGFPVGINNELAGNSDQQISIYPNPACKVLNIAVNSESYENLALRIIDMMGRIVGIYYYRSLKGLNQYSIDLDEFVNGLYFIEVMTGGQKYFRKLVIVNKS